MNKFEMKYMILEYLQDNKYTTINDIRNHITEQLQLRGIAQSSENILMVNEIVWDLIIGRVLTPGKDLDNLDLPNLHVNSEDRLRNELNKDMDL